MGHYDKKVMQNMLFMFADKNILCEESRGAFRKGLTKNSGRLRHWKDEG